MQAEHKVSFPTKLFYGTGAIATGVKDTAFNVFLLFYYTQVVGLPGAVAGAAIFAALLVDAISDPLVGYWSDRFKSSLGRRHPFMYFAAVPMGICFYFLFHPPVEAGQTYLFAWMASFAILVRLFMTFYAVPSFAMIAEMTPDYDQRTALASFRVMLAWLGGLAFAITGYLVFFAATEQFADGRLNPSGYHDFSLLGAVIIVLAILICAAGTQHLVPRMQAVSSLAASSKGLRNDLSNMISNKPFMILVLVILISATAIGFNEVIGLYMFTYFWGFSTEDLAILSLSALVGTILGFIIVPAMSKRFDRKPVGIASMLLVAITLPGLILLRWLDLLPQNGDPMLLLILCGSSTVAVFAAVTMGIIFQSMIADTVDKNELDTGQRQEAIFSSVYTFSLKATSGLGGLLAGICLQLISFPTGVEASEVPASTLTALGFSVAGIIFIFWCIAAFVLRSYPLSRDEHEQLISQIRDKRAEVSVSAQA